MCTLLSDIRINLKQILHSFLNGKRRAKNQIFSMENAKNLLHKDMAWNYNVKKPPRVKTFGFAVNQTVSYTFSHGRDEL